MSQQLQVSRTEHVVGIVGARERSRRVDEMYVHGLVLRLQRTHAERLVIVSGGCKTGADRFAKDYALAHGITYREHPVDGEMIEQVGFMFAVYSRNTLVARDSLDALYALVKSSRRGGTEDTIKKYRAMTKSAHEPRRLFIIHPDFHFERE